MPPPSPPSSSSLAMKMSCNGCRVLRKGCGDKCSIRPCLQWIKSSESQANATVFLAKFYGRAGLMNLINAGPEHLRPAIFRSMLYDACGRIVNPIYGSVGLLWSGRWHLCQAAVEAVLKGAPIAQISSETAAAAPPLKAYDIRHVSKDPAAAELHKVAKSRNRFKRPGARPADAWRPATPPVPEFDRAGSHESAASPSREEMESISSAGSHVSQAEPDVGAEEGEDDVGLELTLGFGMAFAPSRPVSNTRFDLGLALS